MSHKRTGRPPGRPKGAVSAKRRMAHEIIAALEKELGKPRHPLAGLLRIAADTTQPMELRAACNRDALPYVLPRLQNQAIAVAASLEAEVSASVNFDLVWPMADPTRARILQDAAFLLTEEMVGEIQSDRRKGTNPATQGTTRRSYWKPGTVRGTERLNASCFKNVSSV